ncbi:MAG: agmatinase [Nitrososphaeraceae archaeon]
MDIEHFFIIPQKTNYKNSFMDIPIPITIEESKILLYGINLDITTSFGKGTSRGPEAIRVASSQAIETYMLDTDCEVYDFIKIFDLGDLKIPNQLLEKNNIKKILDNIDKSVNILNNIIRKKNKIPLIIGGEHTISYFLIKSIANENPLIIHFDAHRDMKREYQGLKLCHTTPFYHLINDGYIKGKDIIQIGIRQTDKNENDFANKNSVKSFTGWEVNQDIGKIIKYINKKTKNRKIYISLDIDVYDIGYVPCTGTPEPFGLTPFQLIEIIKSINQNSKLIGLDVVEVALKNNDYREAILATETIYRILYYTCKNKILKK